MTIIDSITISTFSFATICMLLLFILLCLLRFFKNDIIKKPDIENQNNQEIINQIAQNTVNAINNLPT